MPPALFCPASDRAKLAALGRTHPTTAAARHTCTWGPPRARACRLSIRCVRGGCRGTVMIDTDDYLDSSPAAVGRRLEWSREALGFNTAREFRETFDPDMANATFSGYLNGSRLLGID